MAIAPTIQTSDFFEKSEVFWAKAIAEKNTSAIAPLQAQNVDRNT